MIRKNYSPSIAITLSTTLCWLMIAHTDSCAQWTVGGRNIAIGQAHTALSSDTWAVFHNPALIDQKNRRFSLFTIRYYGLNELQDRSAVLSFPLRLPFFSEKISMGFASGVHSYGFDLYRETQIRTGLSSRLNFFEFGIAAKFVHLRIERYGATGSLMFDTGLAAEIYEGVRFGCRLTNIYQNNGGEDEIRLYPAEMSIGISWISVPDLILSADVVKDEMHPMSLRAGLELEWMDKITLRGGWTSNPFTWSAGSGLEIAPLHVNFAVQKHEVLGLSPGIDCSLRF